MSQSSQVTKQFGAVAVSSTDASRVSGAGALGALKQDKPYLFVVTTGAATATLAAGSFGQRLTIIMKTDGGDLVLTPSSIVGGTTLTFSAVGQSASLIYDGSNWVNLMTTAALA